MSALWKVLHLIFTHGDWRKGSVSAESLKKLVSQYARVCFRVKKQLRAFGVCVSLCMWDFGGGSLKQRKTTISLPTQSKLEADGRTIGSWDGSMLF